jgi:hypothetical protein
MIRLIVDESQEGKPGKARKLIESVKVHHNIINDGETPCDDEFICENCKTWWLIPMEDLQYCPHCGRKVYIDD